MNESCDCIFMSYQKTAMLIPLNGVVEIGKLKEYQPFSVTPYYSCLVQWDKVEIPLVTFDFASFKIEDLLHPKMVVLKALFSSSAPPFFALLIDGFSCRITVTEKDMFWMDETNKTIHLKAMGKEYDNVLLPDLKEYSSKVEAILKTA